MEGCWRDWRGERGGHRAVGGRDGEMELEREREIERRGWERERESGEGGRERDGERGEERRGWERER